MEYWEFIGGAVSTVILTALFIMQDERILGDDLVKSPLLAGSAFVCSLITFFLGIASGLFLGLDLLEILAFTTLKGPVHGWISLGYATLAYSLYRYVRPTL